MDGLRRKLWGIEVRAPRIEEETGERREERRELVAWIPSWILCCNMLPFPSCVLFFLTTLLFSSPAFLCFSFRGFLQQIAMEWIPPVLFLFLCIVLCVTRCVVWMSERWGLVEGLGQNE